MLSTTRLRALTALRPLFARCEGAAGVLGRAGFASSADARPNSQDADVARARATQSSISDPEMLGNSMSDGFYVSGATWRSGRRATPSGALSSISDPETFWIGSSMSDAVYEMPSALRGRPRSMKPTHSHRSAGPQSLPLMQRVASSRNPKPPAVTDGPLHNSYSHTGY